MWPFKKLDKVEEALKQLERDEEDRAWAAKKAIYGKYFNAPKFYELSNPWYNLKCWIPILVILSIYLWFAVPKFLQYMDKHEKMVNELRNNARSATNTHQL